MVSNLRSHDIVYLLGVIVYILTRFYREHEFELGLLLYPDCINCTDMICFISCYKVYLMCE